MGPGRALHEPRRELLERVPLPARHHFNRPIREVPHVSGDPQSPAGAEREPAEAHALDPAPDPEPQGHAGSRRRFRSISTMTGSTESPMMAMMTRVKLERTAGMLPKK